ncbi:unnamed protein product [Phyllotreta striolata]|uniref:Uncharacterized protein n=1 Tax=Phyllotreta striolata TaxID=444603 RepID=A0A9N9XSL1_PHYSR|nr:unnamed protein product [Phyllotreta striolata]
MEKKKATQTHRKSKGEEFHRKASRTSKGPVGDNQTQTNKHFQRPSKDFSEYPEAPSSSHTSTLASIADLSDHPLSPTTIKKIKKFVPKKRPEVSAKLRRVLTSKVKKPMPFIARGKQSTGKYQDELIFDYPKDMSLFSSMLESKAWRRGQQITSLKKNLQDRKSFWQTLNSNLHERLFVEDDDKYISTCIEDIDPEYKRIVKGRPIADNVSLGDYIQMNRDLLKLKIMIGYREDDLALVNTHLKTETRMIELIESNFQKYVNIFLEFLKRDYEIANNLLSRSNKVVIELMAANEDHRYVLQKLQGIKSQLFKSEARWRLVKWYEKFLYEISPLHWKKENTNSLMRALQHKSCLELFEDINSDTDITLEEIAATVERECCDDEDPVLFFTETGQILDYFIYMEEQNFNSLLYNEELRQPLALIKAEMQSAARNFDGTIDHLRTYIDGLEEGIKWEEERARNLEQIAHDLIFTHFKRIIATTDVLNIHCFVEDVYESIIERNTTNMNAIQMATAIEDFYMRELFVLDQIPASEVAVIQTVTIQKTQKMMILAEQARKAFTELDNTLRGMKKGYVSFVKPLHKPLMFRSAPKEEYRPPPPPPKERPQTQLDYLEHFTDYCRYYDNPKDYGIQVGDSDDEKA